MTEIQPPFSNKPPESGPSEKRPKEPSFISGILEWLGSVISDAASTDPAIQNTLPLAKGHEFSVFSQRQHKVVESAKLIAEDLEELKMRLIEEFGPQSASFIAKCIDPMTSHMKGLVDVLAMSDRTRGGKFEDFLNTAISWVKYYSGLDESKLRYKIVQDAHALVEQSIHKDIEVLVNYKNHTVAENPISTLGVQELEHILQPILTELQNIAATRLDTDNLQEFFRWKADVDEKRNTLIEMGFFVIDSCVDQVSQAKKPVRNEEDEEVEIEQELEDYTLALNAVGILENRLMQFFGLLETTQQIDPGAIMVVEQLLLDLKADVDRLSSLHRDSIAMQRDFDRIHREIERGSALLHAHKERLKSPES